MPDDLPRSAPPDLSPSQTIPPRDLAEEVGIIAEYVPAWIGRDGYPLTWLHAQLALAVIDREHARAALRTASAVGSVHATKEDREKWRGLMRWQARWD